jgi:siroheme synthase-like protein
LFLPVMLDLRGREALVVGADEDAIRRVERLLRAGARVRVVAREVPEALRAVAADGGVHLEERLAREEDMDGAAITYVATSEEAQAAALHARALRTGQPMCTIDRPELSTFINPAVAEAGPLAIAISTGGVSPALARRLREDLDVVLREPGLVEWLEELRAAREAMPRGERAARGAEAVKGFALEGKLRLPGNRGGSRSR